MEDNSSVCRHDQPAPAGAVPRTCLPFAHVPAVPVVVVPSVPVPVPAGLPVLSVAGVLPDRTGNVDVTRFLEEWAASPLAGKADKVPSAAAGNLASLDASGNLADSGATPASIKAAAVAEVVANAPGTMDTLREIADILGSSQQSGTVLKRISDLESGKVDKVQGKGLSANDYTDADKAKLAGIAAGATAVSVDSALSATSENPVQNKVVTNALYTGFTEWQLTTDNLPPGSSFEGVVWSDSQWVVSIADGIGVIGVHTGAGADAESITFQYQGTTNVVSRHLITPTKTSQLTNDGAPNGGGTPYATTSQIPDVTVKADKVAGATAGNLAALNAQGDLTDSGVKPSDFAAKYDLPYALVTQGEWSFSGSGVQEGVTYSVAWNTSDSAYELLGDGVWLDTYIASEDFLDLIDFAVGIVATRTGIHLLDRAVNAVSVSSATEITLPEKIAGGKSRDFYVRLSVSAESAVTFSATDSGGDAVSWDSMGNPSATLAAGTYLYRFTEVADGVFHAADITSGGSIDPAVLDEKLDASSAAPPFSESLTYLVGEYVTYGGVLYRCKTAVTTAGAWTGTSNWEADDMTSPDATLDIMSDGRLRVVTVAGEDLWMQGYDLESTSAQVLKCEKVNLLSFPATTASAFDSTVAYAVGDSVVYGGMVYKFTAAHSAGAWIGTDAAVDSVSLTMPYVPVGKVGDFVLDVDNSANASVKMVAELSGLFTAFDVFVDKGRNLSDILTFDGGEQCELYFTMTAFGTQAKPAWKVVKQVVEKQEAGS